MSLEIKFFNAYYRESLEWHPAFRMTCVQTESLAVWELLGGVLLCSCPVNTWLNDISAETLHLILPTTFRDVKSKLYFWKVETFQNEK